MGQYFMFANLDAHQSTGCLGKLGEFFYDAIDFLYLIAVPACPLERTGWSNSKALDNHPVYPGSWAGDRIICLGDYAETWPEGKLDDGNLSEETPGEFTESATEIRTRDFSYDWKLKEAYPSDRVWVLRNLTKKVYVRSNGVPTINEDDSELTYDEHKGFAGKPGLSHILFSRISWSDDFSISMAYDKDEDIARGAWAADRLDVRLLDEVEQELITDGWIDITQVEARRLHDIFIQDHYFECDFPEEPGMASSNDVLVAPASKDHTDE